MPRQRKPTPARGRRAIPGDKPSRKRKPTPISSAVIPQLPDLAPGTSLSPSVSDQSGTLPTMQVAPAQASYGALQQAVEMRDTRGFRERVASRRGTVGLLLFRLGTETFAAELGAVEEAVEVPALHGLPEMRSGMLGMFDLRGRLLPVFSAAGVLGVQLTPGATATLIVRGGGRRIGVAVDDVEDVIDADCALLRNPPAGPDTDGVLLAILQRGNTLASVIDASALVIACLASSPQEHA